MYVPRGNNKAIRDLSQYTKNILDFVIQIKETLVLLSVIQFKIYCFYSLLNEIKIYGISIVMNEIERVHQKKEKKKKRKRKRKRNRKQYLIFGLGLGLYAAGHLFVCENEIFAFPFFGLQAAYLKVHVSRGWPIGP